MLDYSSNPEVSSWAQAIQSMWDNIYPDRVAVLWELLGISVSSYADLTAESVMRELYQLNKFACNQDIGSFDNTKCSIKQTGDSIVITGGGNFHEGNKVVKMLDNKPNLIILKIWDNVDEKQYNAHVPFSLRNLVSDEIHYNQERANGFALMTANTIDNHGLPSGTILSATDSTKTTSYCLMDGRYTETFVAGMNECIMLVYYNDIVYCYTQSQGYKVIPVEEKNPRSILFGLAAYTSQVTLTIKQFIVL